MKIKTSDMNTYYNPDFAWENDNAMQTYEELFDDLQNKDYRPLFEWGYWPDLIQAVLEGRLTRKDFVLIMNARERELEQSLEGWEG